jgi:hypothetical protein
MADANLEGVAVIAFSEKRTVFVCGLYSSRDLARSSLDFFELPYCFCLNCVGVFRSTKIWLDELRMTYGYDDMTEYDKL